MISDAIKRKCWDLALYLGAEANRCCARIDGFEESIRDRAMGKIMSFYMDVQESDRRRIFALECALRWILEYSPEAVPKHVQDILHDTMEE